MRKSLSVPSPAPTNRDRRPAAYAVGLAVAFSAVLAIGAGIDQAGGQALADSASTVYAAHGKHVDTGLLYGLVYAVAGIGATLWLLVLGVARAGKRWSPALAGLVVAITATLALSLLASTEYGERIFPPIWGGLAILPCLPGVAAVRLLMPGRRTRVTRTIHQFSRGRTHDSAVH